MPPSFVSLFDITDCENCTQAKQQVGDREAIIYAPRIAFVEGGICFLYAGDAGYHDSSLDVQGGRHRLYMINDQLEYIRQL
jgi:hypothetical protein